MRRLYSRSTNVAKALDTGLVLRRRALGFLLAPALMVKAVTMGAAICAMLVFAWRAEGNLEVVPFAIFAVACAVSAWLAVAALRAAGGPSRASGA